MWHIGIDLHRETVVFAAVNDLGEVRPPVRLPVLRGHADRCSL